ncbi:tyrosine-type recombinase/integrase [Ramlibacter sp. MAHUQ-53]|uniref:tyrosine-type recombinase/integrase n=1 Tax=unclassified Ramlibacter TaxID=2617605 RepID=UPI0036398EEE
MPVARLTPALIDTLACPPGRAHWEVFDTLLPGLYVDVQPSGRMAFRLRYRTGPGARRHLTLGNARVITVQEARMQAREALRRAHAGGDPATAPAHALGPTVARFFEGDYLPYARSYKRSWGCDASLLRHHVLPALGHRPLGDLTTPDIARLVAAMQDRGYAKGTINRVLVLLRYGYTLALRWQTPGVTANPVKDLRNLRDDNRIERYLSPAQARALSAAVAASENPALRFVVAFLLYTGARKREVLDARWADVDLARRTWRIARTKSGKVRHVPLSLQAVALLRELRASQAEGEAWLFPNPRTGRPFLSLFTSWNRARRAAGLPDFRLHDLRHSFASFLVNAGRSLYEVQELLGHADLRTTTRYAHLSRERLFEAVEAVPGM